MLEHAERAERWGLSRTAQELEDDEVLGLAVIRCLEVLGEAANRVDRTDQVRFAGIPWRQLIGLRNLLIHQYDRLNYAIIERIISDELPPLIVELRIIIEQEYP